jgi:hypothetical protein
MHRYVAGAVVTLLALVTLGACSGDDDSGTGSTGDTSAADASSDGPVGDLRTVLDRQDDAVIKVAYRRGADEFTIAQDHEKESIRSGNALSIRDGANSVDCIELDTQPSCDELPPDISAVSSLGLTFYKLLGDGLSAAVDEIPSLDTTRDVVDGRPALCVRGDASKFLAPLSDAVGRVPRASVRICVDQATGYVLEYRDESNPEDDLVATRVSRPSNADFKPPAGVGGAGGTS